MNPPAIRCVLLADRHHALAEGVRTLLESTFDAVVMVADKTSLFECARRLRPALVVVDLSLVRGQNLSWLREFRLACPEPGLVVISVHDEPSVCRSVMEAGAGAFVLKRTLATNLLTAVDIVLAGGHYVAATLTEPSDSPHEAHA